MIDITCILSVIPSLLGKTSAAQRWAAVRQTPPMWHGAQGLAMLGLVVLTLVCVGIILHLLARHRRMETDRQLSLDDGGFSRTEVELMTALISRSGLVKAEPTFTLDHAITIGSHNYLNSDAFYEKPEPERQKLQGILQSLQAKLGIDPPPEGATRLASSQIPIGAKLTIVPPGPEGEFTASVQKCGEHIEVLPNKPITVQADETWWLRYFDGKTVWEFDAPVLSQNEDGLVVLRHSDEMQRVNLRRFVRVPMKRKAMACIFPFHNNTSEQSEQPEFVEAELNEIAGPGLLLKTPIKAKPGDRLLVVLELEEDRTIQGIGKVRRVDDPQGRLNVYGAELVSLKPSQIAELMSITNAAAIENRKKEESEKETQQHASAMA